MKGKENDNLIRVLFLQVRAGGYMSRIKISACYIVKNEGENLVRSIRSLAGQVDELVVVDTGSTDDTRQLARQMGARVYEYQWQDDFAAARNYALARTQGDWLVLLDADEYFTEQTAGNLRRLLESTGAECNGYLVQIVNYDADKGEVQDRFYQLRLARRQPGLAYQGIIHERLLVHGTDLDGIKLVKKNVLEIIHTGYRQGIAVAKNQRNLQLLHKAMAAGQSEEELSQYLCISYAEQGEWERALYYGWLNIRQGRRMITYGSQCHRILMEYYAKQPGLEAAAKRLELCRLAVEQFPELPDFHGEYSECLFFWQRYREAAEEMGTALALWEKYDGMEPCLLQESHIAMMQKRRGLFEEKAAAAARLRLTACLICRNEAANIQAWLDNVSGFADEIIVVDTGSTDGTGDILAADGIAYYAYSWQGDFGAAKNFALEKVSGDWLVFLDADEAFQYPASVRGSICHLLAQQAGCEAVAVPLYNIDADNNGNIINTNQVVRIFQNKPYLRYEGEVHEQLVDIYQKERQLCTCYGGKLLSVYHTGYSAGVIQQKLARNLQLLLKAIGEGEEAERYYGSLAACYFGRGQYQQALDYALLATSSPYQSQANQGDCYWVALEAMEALGYAYEDMLAVAEAARQLLPDLPDFWGYKGYCLARQGHWPAGRQLLEKAFSLYEAGKKQYTFAGASHFVQLELQFSTYLAECYFHLGEWLISRELYLKVLGRNKWYVEAITGYLDTGAEPDTLYSLYQPDERQQLERLLYLHGFRQEKDKGQENIRSKMTVLAENIQFLFVSLLAGRPDFSSVLVREQLRLLPEGLQKIIYLYHGRGEAGQVITGDDYNSMKAAVNLWGTDEMIAGYAALAEKLAR